MKKAYVKPMMVGERFVANEYCATCGDTVTEYWFKCDAGGGAYGDLYDSNWNLLTEDDFLTTRYFHACPENHKVDKTENYVKGYFVYNDGNDRRQYVIMGEYKDYAYEEVLIYNGEHATTALDPNSWETVKS